MFMKMIIMTNMMMLPMLNHPISMGTMMIIQTTLMCNQQTNNNYTPWMSYIMFVTMIGGMMIMFIYMASIASNEKFKINMIIPIMWMITMMTMYLMFKNNSILQMNEKKMSNIQMEEIKFTMKMFNKPKMVMTLMVMISLMITMISVTKISSTFEGPLKNPYV
uniref:NADH-ubiquinone oxidoreductase chain 6 n=1 Tax=Metaurus sp. 1 YLZ-2024a TaxID=3230283 RepID=A0AAU8G6P3_9HEMI